MNNELGTAYNPKETEERIYKLWEESGFFNPDTLPARHEKPFAIVVPPPNVTGSLHMGHALNTVIQDIIIRKKRMEGYKTLWLPGTDHAGIATQNVVEKDLKKQGLSRHELGREKFLEKIWEWKDRYGNIILDQFKKLGASMDWSRTRFTLDEGYQKSVQEAFLHYHKKGWLYKAERVINWCVKDQTALSDLEIEYKEEKGKLYFIQYPFVDDPGHLTVATTRPETMLGDSAIAVNPGDERYAHVIGKKILLPIQNREIPVVADEEISVSFGTGAVKVTPAHDLLDAKIGEKNNLPVYKVIGPLGKMTEEAGTGFAGLKVNEARAKVVEELTKLGLIEKIEDHTHSVAICYRCESVIEPIPSLQWFLKMDELARMAREAVEKGEVRFHPKNWEKVYIDWLKNIRDWNVSRQIWWGHTIPLEGESDVLDTWFSSALWPFATLGWAEKTKDFQQFYPTEVLVTGRDIINLWVSRMIFSGLELAGKKPFSDVIIHATVLTKDGKRMSKSLGTGVDPMGLIEKYGADATRFGIIWQHMGTQDMHWSEEHVMAGKKFANKLWNITRFVLSKTEDISSSAGAPASSDAQSKEILEKLAATIASVNQYAEKFDFGQAIHVLYDFVWHDFADVYIEYAKTADTEETRVILRYILETILKLLHPFMPFVTEEIYSKINTPNKSLLIVEQWPS
jgi:valyl-tRNA synthetase